MTTMYWPSSTSTTLTAAKTRADCMAMLREVADSFGLQHASITLTPGPADVYLGPLVLESTLPADFAREFDRHQFVRQCPIIPKLAASIVPYIWCLHDTEESGLAENWPADMKALMMRYRLVTGALFPFTSLDTRRYLVRLDGDRERLTQREVNDLSMLSLAIFDQYDRLRRTELAHAETLSARELEVARWTAQGKTSVEIGQILSLSDHTVNAYLTSAMKKLDCVNRTQLVAKAIRLKLID
ncbi:helix-turn-helix transcriptional regulator [Rhizobium paknamense]|uniref:DNA-binding CsgD family transcriptional regulator n=1 Tax=Rhizobium paknamense TaxID=1206817 RepID=A0ABU0I896_9HYPH|nr:LuxR family transcriptional regulator [Rhizobium paknamense]MDQ0454459.1 DNA-binding CsgD family transcriptional regulator [Rhizobium paknamense]